MSSKLIEIKNSGTNLLTVRELLSSGCYFRIPDYQLGYAWQKEFIELWNDILNRLMYLSSLFSEECNFGEMIKSEINNTWKNIYENLCLKTYSLQDDAYLKTHWIVYKDLKKNKGNAYIEQI